jgi:hypothetical protein
MLAQGDLALVIVWRCHGHHHTGRIINENIISVTKIILQETDLGFWLDAALQINLYQPD